MRRFGFALAFSGWFCAQLWAAADLKLHCLDLAREESPQVIPGILDTLPTALRAEIGKRGDGAAILKVLARAAQGGESVLFADAPVGGPAIRARLSKLAAVRDMAVNGPPPGEAAAGDRTLSLGPKTALSWAEWFFGLSKPVRTVLTIAAFQITNALGMVGWYFVFIHNGSTPQEAMQKISQAFGPAAVLLGVIGYVIGVAELRPDGAPVEAGDDSTDRSAGPQRSVARDLQLEAGTTLSQNFIYYWTARIRRSELVPGESGFVTLQMATVLYVNTQGQIQLALAVVRD